MGLFGSKLMLVVHCPATNPMSQQCPILLDHTHLSFLLDRKRYSNAILVCNREQNMLTQ